MSYLNRWTLAGVVSAGVLCAGLIVANISASRRPGITKANFDRVEKGMSKAEVQAILGSDSRFSGSTFSLRWMTVRETWHADDGAEAEITFLRSEYADDGAVAEIDFLQADNKDRVFHVKWTPSSETALERVLRWLHLRKN